ncbi:MAG: PP2C family protein-serine/threonine phosphatase [Armatimonadota bacterium]|nr:serine/threonine-protein phosphatase [Armatimonadota bacterium]MCX7777273.1 serine/threonine-protein phosphatase [Armatimonadota bacterium]MDW8024687.1 PP2C family protein-serine/threonine phosphatase [Armatimonadota bacterium]
MRLHRLRASALQPPDASDWIVVVVRSLLLIMLASLVTRGWVWTDDRGLIAASALTLALVLNAIAVVTHWRGFSLRMPSLIIDAIWVWLWMAAVGEQSIYFMPMLVLIVIIAGMWYRLIGSFLTASLCGAFWLYIRHEASSIMAMQLWITLSSLSFIFLAALLSGYMSEARLYAEHMLAKYRQEMFASRYLHEHMTPKELPRISGWQLARLSRPARVVVGGDFHDFINCGDGSYAILLGDVCGKGIDAQIRVPTVKSAIKLGLKSNSTMRLSDALNIANGILVEELPEAFATAVILRVAQNDGCVNVASAGHAFTLLLRADGAVEHLRASGPPLGASHDVNYSDEQICLSEGDVLVVLTDGVIEARSESGEPFGIERLRALLCRLNGLDAHKIASSILEETLKFSARATDDDITIIVAKYLPELNSKSHDER